MRSSGLDDAVLDLTGEDAGGMTARSKQYHWDKRHKRYVKLQPGEELKPSGKRMKTESGAKVSRTPVLFCAGARNLRVDLRCVLHLILFSANPGERSREGCTKNG